MLNAQTWKELKKQLRSLQGKAIFELERNNLIKSIKNIKIVLYNAQLKCYNKRVRRVSEWQNQSRTHKG